MLIGRVEHSVSSMGKPGRSLWEKSCCSFLWSRDTLHTLPSTAGTSPSFAANALVARLQKEFSCRKPYSTPRRWHGHRHAACYHQPGWAVLGHFTPTGALQEAPCAHTPANHRASMCGCCLFFPDTQGSSGPPLPLLLSPPLGTQDSSVLSCPSWEKLSVMES